MIYISFDIGVKNLAICILEYTDVIKIVDWRIISLAETKKEIKGIDDISERIFVEMDNVIGSLKEKSVDFIDYVLIENQPSNLNGIMKTIQHIIYSYFSLVKYWDKTVGNVVLVNASLKCKTHEYKPEIALADVGEKNSKGFKREKYKQNKAMSIAICRHYIQCDEKLLEIFDANKKKDDLSDSCLQAVSYIRSKASDVSKLNVVSSV
jgi:hypothetical protein